MPTKEQIKDGIAHLLGLTAKETPPMSTGSTEPRKIFDLIVTRCNLSISRKELTKSELAGAIVREAGGDWNSNCWSRGETVTKVGLLKVQKAVLTFREQQFDRRQAAFAYLSPSELGVENDYESLAQEGNTGIAPEYAIAANLMAPDQRAEFTVRTIERHKNPGVRRRIEEILRHLDSSCINQHCLGGLPQTDSERYVRLVPRRHDLGPSDLIVYDLRTRDSKVGLSIKEGNLNIKNPGPEGGLGLPRGFIPRYKRRLHRVVVPQWIEEMRADIGDLEYRDGGTRHNWSRKTPSVVTDFYAEIADEVVGIFNDKTREEQKALIQSWFHLDANPIHNFYYIVTNKNPIYVKEIIREHRDRFRCEDPAMERRTKTKVQVLDRSGTDPMQVEVQVKCNNGLIEMKDSKTKTMHSTEIPVPGSPYFSVDSPHSPTGRFVLKYGNISSWNVTLKNRPSQDFWETVYTV